MVRPTYAEIDLGAIAHNVSVFRDLISPSVVCTIVKADAYGHGDVPVATTAVQAGAEMLGVALVEEGIRLREAGVSAPIIVLSEPDPHDAGECAVWDLQPTVYSERFVDSLVTVGFKGPIHMKVDTGMHRVGLEPDRLDNLIRLVRSKDRMTIESVWSHFPVADEDAEFTTAQIERFEELTGHLDVPTRHLSNTAGATLFPNARLDMCRIGLGTYGLHPTPETMSLVDLQPAMRLVSHVTHVQRRKAGDRLSYGRVRDLDADATVVTVPVGYADGYARRLTDDGCALIGGRRFRLAGTVTMDQIVVDVGDEEVDVGQEVVLLGRQGDGEISAGEWAEDLGTIAYEVVCSIGPRVPRRHV